MAFKHLDLFGAMTSLRQGRTGNPESRALKGDVYDTTGVKKREENPGGFKDGTTLYQGLFR